jgi:hypothetical protein
VTGVLVMWRMWVGQASGRGNANYLYFQSLAFHATCSCAGLRLRRCGATSRLRWGKAGPRWPCSVL